MYAEGSFGGGTQQGERGKQEADRNANSNVRKLQWFEKAVGGSHEQISRYFFQEKEI